MVTACVSMTDMKVNDEDQLCRQSIHLPKRHESLRRESAPRLIKEWKQDKLSFNLVPII